MQGLIINAALILTRSIQKNISLILPFLAFSFLACPINADEPSSPSLPLVLMINLKSAQTMGVTIPDEIKNQAKIIGDRT
jgi:hypothetical protein